MQPSWYLVLVAALEALGIAASLNAAYRLHSVSKAINSPGLRLASYSFIVFALGLLLELLGNLLASTGHPHHRPLGRPEEVALLVANRGVLLAAPVYIVAYTLYTVSVMVEHVETERSYAAIPLVVQVYADTNIVAAIVLLTAGYMVYTRRGVAPEWLVFYTVLVASHILQAIAGLTADPAQLAAGVALRALSPILFHTVLIVAERQRRQ